MSATAFPTTTPSTQTFGFVVFGKGKETRRPQQEEFIREAFRDTHNEEDSITISILGTTTRTTATEQP